MTKCQIKEVITVKIQISNFGNFQLLKILFLSLLLISRPQALLHPEKTIDISLKNQNFLTPIFQETISWGFLKEKLLLVKKTFNIFREKLKIEIWNLQTKTDMENSILKADMARSSNQIRIIGKVQIIIAIKIILQT